MLTLTLFASSDWAKSIKFVDDGLRFSIFLLTSEYSFEAAEELLGIITGGGDLRWFFGGRAGA